MDFKRADRVADLIKQEISDILRREAGDPRIAVYRLTAMSRVSSIPIPSIRRKIISPVELASGSVSVRWP